MKKTLIALAVAASAVVSGSAMAGSWVRNGTGGTVEFGGTLTPVEKATPWSIKVGGGVSDLDAQVQKGQRVVSVPVKKSILFLGIAPTDGSFHGQDGISPQIDYNGAIDVGKFLGGATKIKLPVKDAKQNPIGYMEADFTAVSFRQWKEKGKVIYQGMYAAAEGDAFYGGVPNSADGSMDIGKVEGTLQKLEPEIIKDKWKGDESRLYVRARNAFAGDQWEYQGFYGGGLTDTTIKITLDTPVKGDDSFSWRATLPVVVNYQ